MTSIKGHNERNECSVSDVNDAVVDKKPFQCQVCDKLLSNRTRLLKHLERQHENPQIHLCLQCSEEFETKVKLV
jgi:hypothetical protein